MKGQMEEGEESWMTPRFLSLDDEVVVVPSTEMKKSEKGRWFGAKVKHLVLNIECLR